MGPITGWMLGLLLGVRHALEPDHLAAVSTLMTTERSARRSAVLGAFWGMGHTLSLLFVGTTLTILQTQMPGLLANRLELTVAVMLLCLGALNLWRAFHLPDEGPAHFHHHGDVTHSHPARESHVHLRQWTFGLRPLAVGLVHGLAGSGALTALALAHVETPAARVVYMALFGVGSMVGMSLLAGLLGLPLRGLMQKPRVRPVLTGLTGVLSMGLGITWGWPLLGM